MWFFPAEPFTRPIFLIVLFISDEQFFKSSNGLRPIRNKQQEPRKYNGVFRIFLVQRENQSCHNFWRRQKKLSCCPMCKQDTSQHTKEQKNLHQNLQILNSRWGSVFKGESPKISDFARGKRNWASAKFASETAKSIVKSYGIFTKKTNHVNFASETAKSIVKSYGIFTKQQFRRHSKKQSTKNCIESSQGMDQNVQQY